MTTPHEKLHQGRAISSGIAIGKVFYYSVENQKQRTYSVSQESIASEISRYRQAVENTKKDIYRLQELLRQEGAEEGAQILETYQQLLTDSSFTTEIERRISTNLQNVESVFQNAILEYEKKFSAIPDAFFQERFKDILDLSRRILKHLAGSKRMTLEQAPQGAVILAHELGITDIAGVQANRVRAFITESGGETSHAAIMARAKGIPFVANVDIASLAAPDNSELIVDGDKGIVIALPSRQTRVRYSQLQTQQKQRLNSWSEQAQLASETIDGYRVRLSGNLEDLEEVVSLKAFSGDGVGLYRSENLCLNQHKLPSEEEQYQAYCSLARSLDGLPLIIRTFDIGGDKFCPDEHKKEANPFLGCRAIRFLLREEKIFKEQVRAILRASCFGQVGIMFPMISDLSELLAAKKLVASAAQELRREGVEVAPSIPIGCMIETPAAALCSDMLAAHCDFLSIGTNDLIQYSMAVDRGNKSMSYLYRASHPSILRLIKMVVGEANQNRIPVSICGEMAADPRFTPLLLGMGVYELSVAPRSLPLIRQAIRRLRIVEATRFADEILQLPSCDAIEGALHEYYEAYFMKAERETLGGSAQRKGKLQK